MHRTAIALFLLGSLAVTGCIERWVYVDVQSKPPGARVRSKGLDAPHALPEGKAPGGHFLRCTMDAVTPDLKISSESWSYVFSLADHNDEEVFVDRVKVAKACADSQQLARQKPFRVAAMLLSASTEKGLNNSVLITSTPAGATLVDDRTGDILGRTPLRRVYVFYAPYQQEHSIRLELPGYVVVKRIINVKTLALHANLHRPGEQPPPQPPPKSKATPAPAPAAE